MRNCECECETFFNAQRQDEVYRLSNFTFENLKIKAHNKEFHPEIVDGFKHSNINVE
jgi:hypothetical protein